MSIQQQLLDLGECFNFSDLSTFTQNIPTEWVASALDLPQRPRFADADYPATRVTLRSKKIDLIYQDVWGLLMAYNIIRREASQAAIAFGRTPSDIRFKPACQYIAVQLIVMAAANPVSATGRRLAELRAGVGGLFLDHRPRPGRPRTMKISKTRYPVDRKAAPLK